MDINRFNFDFDVIIPWDIFKNPEYKGLKEFDLLLYGVLHGLMKKAQGTKHEDTR